MKLYKFFLVVHQEEVVRAWLEYANPRGDGYICVIPSRGQHNCYNFGQTEFEYGCDYV